MNEADKNTPEAQHIELPPDSQCADDNQHQSPSKTRRKKEMHRLQELGEQLTRLGNADIEKLPISNKLRDAINELKRIKSREARRRQMQFIGRLMRDEAVEPIEEVLKLRQEQHLQDIRQQHLIERWRDEIIDSDETIERFLLEHPEADRQWLKQMRRQILREREKKQPPASARKLFAYIRVQLRGD